MYWESLNTSLREIRANLRVIVLSSVVLVVVTMAAVAYAARALGMDPRAAWVLGAVLAPTDAAAVAGLAKRLPRRTLTTLRAESLINDGTALVLFGVATGVAVGAVSAGPFTIAGSFVGSYAGGIAAGLLASGLVVLVRRRLVPQRGVAWSWPAAAADLRRAARHPRPVAEGRRSRSGTWPPS